MSKVKSRKALDFRQMTLRLVKYNKQNKGVWGMPVALRGEEGRDKLRKATGIGTHE